MALELRRAGRRATCTLVAVACLLAAAPPAAAQKLVYVVRHAERADAGAAGGEMTAQTDPPLSAAGEARAARLATMLADAGVTAVFATEYRRTQETGKPLASKLGLAVEATPSRDVPALISRLKATHADDIVLIVGHSNTVPAIIKAFGGPDVTIGENEYDNLFVIVPKTGVTSRIRY
ncbi:MAG: phosphoglycerate mutase family protein [Vicinamibacterales bacterium]